MLIECEYCHAKYKITMKKSPGKPVRFRCGKCHNMILIQPDAAQAQAVPARIPATVPEKEPEKGPVELPTRIPGPKDKNTLQATCIKCGAGFVKQARDKSRLCYQCRIDAIVAKKRAKAVAASAAPKIDEEAKHKYTIRNADGLILGPIKLRTVAVLVREKRVHGKEEVKKDDEPYKPILEIPELAQLFPHLKPGPEKDETKEEKTVEATAPEAETREPEEPSAEGKEIEEEIDIPIEVEDETGPVEAEAEPEGAKPPAARPEEEEEELGAAVVDEEPMAERAAPLPEKLWEEEDEAEAAGAVLGLDEISIPGAGAEEKAEGAGVEEEKGSAPEPIFAEDEDHWAALDAKARKVEEILAREGIGDFEPEEEPQEVEPEEERVEEEKEEPWPEEQVKKKEKLLGRIKPARIFRDRARPKEEEEEKVEELKEEAEEEPEELEELTELMEEVEEEVRYTVRYSDGMVLGPVKLSTVRDLFAAGNLTGNEEIQRGDDPWIPVTECQGLKDLFGEGDEIAEDEIVELTELLEEVE